MVEEYQRQTSVISTLMLKCLTVRKVVCLRLTGRMAESSKLVLVT